MLAKSSLFSNKDNVVARDPRLAGYGQSSGGTPSPAGTAASSMNAANSPTATPAADAKPAKSHESVSANRLMVGPDVKLKGAEILDCDTLVVEGRVEATMDSRVINIATGRVSGTIRYGKILIEEGGEISGDVRSLASEAATPTLTQRSAAPEFPKAVPAVAGGAS